MGRGYSGVNFGHLKSEVFQKGGDSRVNFGHLKSEVFQNVGGGGYSRVNSGHLKSEVFRNGGGEGGFLVSNSRKGLSGKFGQKFFVQPETCLCITDSLSHTTYVETNKTLGFYGSRVTLL